MSKFFIYEERLSLQKYLKDSLSFKEIARRMDKNPAAISREVRKYSSRIATGYPGFPFNACKSRFDCREKKVCGKERTRKSDIYCKLCQSYILNCTDFLEEICMQDFGFPMSAMIVEQGQSANQIYINHQDELMCSEKAIYNYIDACLFDIRKIGLPQKVKFRERYKKPEFKVDKGCRIDHNHKNFCEFLEKDPDSDIVQMDSFIGEKGGKCLLTIHFVKCSFMLAFLRDANTSKSVTDIFKSLHQTLGHELFKKLFPVILTDNGSEFLIRKQSSMEP